MYGPNIEFLLRNLLYKSGLQPRVKHPSRPFSLHTSFVSLNTFSLQRFKAHAGIVCSFTSWGALYWILAKNLVTDYYPQIYLSLRLRAQGRLIMYISLLSQRIRIFSCFLFLSARQCSIQKLTQYDLENRTPIKLSFRTLNEHCHEGNCIEHCVCMLVEWTACICHYSYDKRGKFTLLLMLNREFCWNS